MRQAVGPWLERGLGKLEGRGLGSGPKLKRFIYEPGRERVRIDDLISPLRYDILVRQGYFTFLRDHRALAAEDFKGFLELSRREPYFAWFKGVAIPVFHSAWGHDAQSIDAAFERRVHRCIAIHDDLETHGYDASRPIILRAGRRIAPTSTGKRVTRPIYAGDGCHRLAWLRAAGAAEVEPWMYRLQRARTFAPRDLTAVVLDAMEVDRADYFAFLALPYDGRRLDKEEDLLAHVAESFPARLEELKQVIAIDSPSLATARD
jgi:hypothetical protein